MTRRTDLHVAVSAERRTIRERLRSAILGPRCPYCGQRDRRPETHLSDARCATPSDWPEAGGYAPQGYYDPIEVAPGEIIDHDDPRPAAVRVTATDITGQRRSATVELVAPLTWPALRPDRRPAKLARCRCRPSHIDPATCPSYGGA